MSDQEIYIELGIVGIKNMGEYNSQTNYDRLNVVTYEGSTYCALKSTIGNLPTNTDYWQLYAQKGGKGDTGPQGPAPVKGVDYYTSADKTEIENDLSDSIHQEVSEQVGSLVSATPLAASSVSDMIDTTRIYVNATDGNWYYYNGNSWVIGDVYQATAIADESVTTKKIAYELKEKLNLENIELPLSFRRGSFYNHNGVVEDGSSGQNNRIKCRNILINNGDVFEFNNTNNLYKFGYAITDNSQNIIEYKGFNDYISNPFSEITIQQGYYFNVQIAYADDTDITDEEIEIISNMVEFNRYKINSVTGYNIKEKTIDISQIKGIDNITDNLFNGEFETYSYGTGYSELRNSSANARGVLFKVEPNETYNIKIFDEHNRFRLIALADYPKFVDGVLPISIGKVITTDDTLNEYTFINNNLFKYIVLCVSTTSQEPRLMISKNVIDSYEEYKVKISGLEAGNNLSVLDRMTREVYFTETAYTENCEMQGCCSDGTYLYFGMHDLTDTDNGVIGKIDLATGLLISEVKNHSYGHVNGMCYYNNKLYIASASDPTNTPSTVYVVNADDLSYDSEFSLESTLKTPWENISYGLFNGVGAIAYSDELNKFVCLIRKNSTGKRFRGLAILDNNFNLEKILKINPDDTPETNPTTVGGLDADDKYIYLTMIKNIPDNYSDVIHIYDYNGNLIEEKILTQSPRDFIEGITKIGNTIYTSNASDKICKYTINSYKKIPLANILIKYNPN